MKTQRMDAEHKRLNEEIARRELQRKLHYSNKRETHKKLYSRVLAKNVLSGIEDITMKMFSDINYFRDEVKEGVEGSFYDWLINSTCSEIERTGTIRQAAENIVDRVPFELNLLHKHYLDKEKQRLDGIAAREKAQKEKLEAERAERRAVRHLMRVSRTKRKLREEIEAKIYSKKSLENEILGLKLISYFDEDSEMKKFRTYGGLLYELWSVLNYAREAVNTKVDPPHEKFLVQDDEIKKFVINFLSDPSIKEKSIRIDINLEHKPQFEAAINQMESDLQAFNETKEETISNIVQLNDLVVSSGVEYCMSHNKLEPMIYNWLLVNFLRIFFKSNDYKIAEDVAPVVDDDKKNDNGIDNSFQDPGNTMLPVPGAALTKQGSQTSGLAAGDEPSQPKNPGSSTRRKSTNRLKHVGPEITDEDRRLEALKKKLDIHFVPADKAINPNTVAIFRIREGLNREVLRPEVEKRIHDEKERKRLEAEAVEDPKKHLEYHRKQYLLDEYLAELKAKEEAQKLKEEEEEIKRKEQHIEQYYGDAYQNDFLNYDFEEGERAPTNINEELSLGNDRAVVFIHRVNESLYRKAIVDKLRECFKEITLIKDIDLDKRILPLDGEIEADVIHRIVKDKDQLPIFDVEI